MPEAGYCSYYSIAALIPFSHFDGTHRGKDNPYVKGVILNKSPLIFVNNMLIMTAKLLTLWKNRDIMNMYVCI